MKRYMRTWMAAALLVAAGPAVAQSDDWEDLPDAADGESTEMTDGEGPEVIDLTTSDTPAEEPAAETPEEPAAETPAEDPAAEQPQDPGQKPAEEPAPGSAAEGAGASVTGTGAQDDGKPKLIAETTPERAKDGKNAQDRHVVSQSKMFSVSGGDVLRMGAIAQRADEIRAQVNTLLQDDGKWRYAISIRLLGQQDDAPMPNPIRTRIRIIDGEPNLQIRVYSGGGINVDQLTQAIVSMLLFERAIREVPADALPEKLALPPWLTTGIRQALLWRSGKVDRRLYRNLFEQSEMLTPQEIISAPVPSELDAAARQVYDVSCGVLVMSLLSRPDGALRLRELISEAVVSEGSPVEIISNHFVEAGVDENMLSRWWALELANLAQPRATDALTPMETELQLREALTVLYYDPDDMAPQPISVDDVYMLVEVPEWKQLLRGTLEKLMVLNMSCFPDYRPIIADYVRAIGELLKGTPPDEVLQIIGPLREVREGFVKSAIRGRDYLDWYEITQLPGGKGKEADFRAYMDAMHLLRNQTDGPDTPISRYLEDVEELYRMQTDSPLPKRMQDELDERRGPVDDKKSGKGGKRGK